MIGDYNSTKDLWSRLKSESRPVLYTESETVQTKFLIHAVIMVLKYSEYLQAMDSSLKAAAGAGVSAA